MGAEDFVMGKMRWGGGIGGGGISCRRVYFK